MNHAHEYDSDDGICNVCGKRPGLIAQVAEAVVLVGMFAMYWAAARWERRRD